MQTETIYIKDFIIRFLKELIEELNKDNLILEQRNAYNYFLKKFVMNFLEGRYTLSKNYFEHGGKDDIDKKNKKMMMGLIIKIEQQDFLSGKFEERNINKFMVSILKGTEQVIIDIN